MIDGGAPYPVAGTAVARHLDVTARLRNARAGNGSAQDCSLAVGAYWADKGRAEALAEFRAGDLRLLSAGTVVRDGTAAVAQADTLAGAVLGKMHVAKSQASEQGDVVSYGDVGVPARLDAPARRYAFLQAWDVGKRCRIALEMLNPIG